MIKRYANNGKFLLGICLIAGVFASQSRAESEYSSNKWLDKVYVGVFGGTGSFTANNITQSGTAFYTPPLYVNAHGDASTNSLGMIGGQVGYRWSNLLIQSPGSNWKLLPVTELEGYYMNGTMNGSNLVNDTARLSTHTFSVSYPMHTGVFLLNGVLNFNNTQYAKTHPYLGLGVGTAIVSINNATSTQTSPEEAGINHYNSDPDASDWTFAFQSKAGVRFDFVNNAGIFLEYRFLCLSPTDYTFGSTQYSTHIPTAPWNVDIGNMYYNMVTLGIQYDL